MTDLSATTPGEATPRAVLLMGPTATGKTDLAVRLAQDWPFEIVSVDSALVYRGMDIGTAKPDAATRAHVPHHLIDICDPADTYSAGRFSADALRVMREITTRGRIPLLVGGTMLYFRALQQGLSQLPTADAEVRAQIEARARSEGWERLHAELARVDPAAAARIHPNDPQRIQRALEVHAITGRALSDHFPDRSGGFPYAAIKIALMPADRGEIHRRVAQRFRSMLDQGLLDEVRRLRERSDLHLGLPSMRAVGYRQVWEYLAAPGDLQGLIDRAVIATRQLAKRQLTWLRSESGTWPVDPFHPGAEQAIRQFLQTQLV